jgi:glycosyltransferase involved in cell wall biosynthesis
MSSKLQSHDTASKIKVLFISNTARVDQPYLDPAVRYRCFNPAFDLTKLGHTADVIAFSQFNLGMIDNYDLFVFHKPPKHNTLEAAIDLIVKRGKQTFADYDDLIFDQRNALSSSLYLTGRASKKIVLDIFAKNHYALSLFSHVTTSTTALAQQVKISNPKAKVTVIHNGLNQDWIDYATRKYASSYVDGLISYFCGTKSHDHDFKIIESTLAHALHSNPNLTLRIVGPLTFDTAKFPLRQLMLVKAVPYEVLPHYIMQSYINIAPLEDNTFNKSKSGLKFFEAGIFGVPSIASPIPDIARFKDSGIELPKKDADWEPALGRMLSMSADEHRLLRKSTAEYTETHCLSTPQTNKILSLI